MLGDTLLIENAYTIQKDTLFIENAYTMQRSMHRNAFDHK